MSNRLFITDLLVPLVLVEATAAALDSARIPHCSFHIAGHVVEQYLVDLEPDLW